MLDWYYLNEKALPADVAKVSRLIRCPPKLDAVVTAVLAEFFVLSDDGWHSHRADEELTKMFEKQEQQSAKDQHEKERMRRYRERRAEMFSALRERGVVPAWDVPMKDLQRIFDETCNAPATRTGALPETDVQRLSLPTPTPTPIKKRNTSADALTVASLVGDGLTEQTAGEFIAHRKAKGAKLTARAWQGVVAEAGKAGWPVEQAVCKALARGWTGFEAAWVASESPRQNGARHDVEPVWRSEQRERTAAFAGPAAARRPTTTTGEVFDVAASLVG